MLVDAIRAEGFRLTRNRTLMFFSVLCTPLLFAIGGVFYHLMSKAKGDELAAKMGLSSAAGAPVNLGDALTFGAQNGANGLVLIFMLIGAATLYAGDYRWETWRLISARNSRIQLILGKVGVFKLLALAAMLAFLVASFLYSLSQSIVFERPLTFNFSGEQLGQFALLWLLAWVRIIQFAMIALLTAVFTRSLLAALFVPWALGFAQSLFGQLAAPLLGWEPGDWASQLLLPGLAFDTLKAFVAPEPGAVITAEVAWRALLSLSLWTLVPLAGALAWFKRQDLSKE